MLEGFVKKQLSFDQRQRMPFLLQRTLVVAFHVTLRLTHPTTPLSSSVKA